MCIDLLPCQFMSLIHLNLCFCCHFYMLTVIDRKFLSLLEEIRQQNQTIIHLQQQILDVRNKDGQPPCELDGRLPASTTEELKLIDAEAADNNILGGLVCIYFPSSQKDYFHSLVRGCSKLTWMQVVRRDIELMMEEEAEDRD